MSGFRFALSPRRSSSPLMTAITSSLSDGLLKRPGQDLHALAGADPDRVAHQRSRRRSAGNAAVGVVDPAMAGTQEQLGTGAPVHRAAEMGAVETKCGEIDLARAP